MKVEIRFRAPTWRQHVGRNRRILGRPPKPVNGVDLSNLALNGSDVLAGLIEVGHPRLLLRLQACDLIPQALKLPG
jgi:hypothetical protein